MSAAVLFCASPVFKVLSQFGHLVPGGVGIGVLAFGPKPGVRLNRKGEQFGLLGDPRHLP
jgi:hypothetical protein